MMKNVMMTLAFCLCTATLFAQQIANTADAQGISTSRKTQYSYSRTRDDKPRRSAGELIDSIRNSPNWKAEREAFSAAFYNSAAWKKSKEESSRSLPLWDEHSTTGNKAWQDAVGKSNAELENSDAYKTYQAKVKDFNRRIDQELIKQLSKTDPRYKTVL